MFGLRNFFTIVCACCLFGQSRTAGDLNSNPGWVRVRALIEQHSLQSHSDRIAAVWTATGGEDCKKALMGAGIKKDAATEICSTDNPERSKNAGAAQAESKSQPPAPVRTDDRPSPSPREGQQPLTNETITKMIRAGLAEAIVLGMIDTHPGTYTITTRRFDLAQERRCFGSNHSGSGEQGQSCTCGTPRAGNSQSFTVGHSKAADGSTRRYSGEVAPGP